jgi:hypothetical protein
MMLMMHKSTPKLYLAKRGMLQIYPPYKNLVPRFVGSTREKGTRVTRVFNDFVDPTMIFFIEEIDP